MVDVVFEHGGTLDKYLATASWPTSAPPSRNGSRVARGPVRGRCAPVRLNAERDGAAPLRMGIGIHGAVVLGDIGASRRRDYTVVGDAERRRTPRLTKTEGVDILVRRRRVAAGEAISLSAPRALQLRVAPCHDGTCRSLIADSMGCPASGHELNLAPFP